jgi:hypothetical protein
MIKHKSKIIITHKLLQTSSESMKQQRTKVPVKKKKKSIGG